MDPSVDINAQIPVYIIQSILESVWLSGLERDCNTDLSISQINDQLILDFKGPTGSFKIHPKVEAKTRLALDRLALMNNDPNLDYSVKMTEDVFVSIRINLTT